MDQITHAFESFAHAYSLVRRQVAFPNDGAVDVEAAARDAGEVFYRLIPATVLLAFTVEIGLKALLMKARGQFRAVHELQVLAEGLPGDMRAPLTAAAGTDWNSLHQALTKNGKVFEEWRYAFETGSVSVDEQHLEPLIPAIRELLTGKREASIPGGEWVVEAHGSDLNELRGALGTSAKKQGRSAQRCNSLRRQRAIPAHRVVELPSAFGLSNDR